MITWARVGSRVARGTDWDREWDHDKKGEGAIISLHPGLERIRVRWDRVYGCQSHNPEYCMSLDQNGVNRWAPKRKLVHLKLLPLPLKVSYFKKSAFHDVDLWLVFVCSVVLLTRLLQPLVFEGKLAQNWADKSLDSLQFLSNLFSNKCNIFRRTQFSFLAER